MLTLFQLGKDTGLLDLLLELPQGVVKRIAVTHVYTWQTDHLPFSILPALRVVQEIVLLTQSRKAWQEKLAQKKRAPWRP
jgi:hypothetical protein